MVFIYSFKDRQIFLLSKHLLIICKSFNSQLQVTKKRKASTPRNVSIPTKQQKYNETRAVIGLLQLAGTMDDSVMSSTSFDDKSKCNEANNNFIGVQVQPRVTERKSQTDIDKQSSNI